MPQPKACCSLQYMICCIIIMLTVETEYIMQLNEMEKNIFWIMKGMSINPKKSFLRYG